MHYTHNIGVSVHTENIKTELDYNLKKKAYLKEKGKIQLESRGSIRMRRELLKRAVHRIANIWNEAKYNIT